MKRKCDILTGLILLSFLSIYSLANEPEDKTRVWEKYAAHTYSNLNTHLNGELAPVFRSLGDYDELHQCFSKQNPEKYEAYRQFLIQVLGDAMRKDVVEAMFANVLIELTPAHVLLSMIAPEIGPQGKLHGILDGQHSDIAKKIERRSQVIYEGNVNFNHYVSYLKAGKDRGYTNQPNAEIIVEHMFRTDPQEAFISMLWADYGFLPYAEGNCYLFCKQDADEVRRLQQMQVDIKDYLFRSRYYFPVAEGMDEAIKRHLKALGQHKKSWVRLYFVSLIEKERPLRFSGILDGSTDDADERVRATVARINKEDPPYWKAIPHSQTNMVTSESSRTVSRPSATMDTPSASGLHRVPAAVMFNYDKSEIRPEAYPDLDRIGQLLGIRSDSTARIEMHTDKLAKSSSSYCQRLSQKRAEAVKTYFINKFAVDPSRLNAVGCGFDSPSEPNDLIKGNPANRRVDIYINNNPGMNEEKNP